MVFQSPKYEEIILPYEFVFVFITYFIEAILSKKFVRSRGFEKKNKKVGMAIIVGCL